MPRFLIQIVVNLLTATIALMVAGAVIDGVTVRQHHENGSVSVELDVTTKCHAGCEIYADFDGKRVLLKNGHGIIQVDNPKLWWARGYGDQPLYDLDVELVCGGEVIDRCHKQLGLRTLTLQTGDAYRERLHLGDDEMAVMVGGGAVRDNAQLNAFIAGQTALGRVGVPDDIGPLVAALLQPATRWVNAQRIEASGGMFL